MQCRNLCLAAAAIALLGMMVLGPGAHAKKHKKKAEKKQKCMYKCPKHPAAKATWKAKCPKCKKKMCPADGRKKAAKKKGEAKAGCPMKKDCQCPRCPMKKASGKKGSCPKKQGKCPHCPMDLKKKVEKLEKKTAHLGGKMKKLHRKLRGMHRKMKGGKKDKEKCWKEEMKEKMKKMKRKMSPAQHMRHKMLMKAELEPVDPQALLPLKDKLDLDKEQVMRLRVILETTRDLAKESLTDKQMQKLKKLHGTPDSMMGLHRKMMKKMQK